MLTIVENIHYNYTCTHLHIFYGKLSSLNQFKSVFLSAH